MNKIYKIKNALLDGKVLDKDIMRNDFYYSNGGDAIRILRNSPHNLNVIKKWAINPRTRARHAKYFIKNN